MARTDSFRILPQHDRLLRGSPATPAGLYQLQPAIAAQLCRLHYSASSITHVKEQLKALADHGYVRAGSVPTTTPGNPYYYTLGPAGVRYLASLGYDVAESYRPSKAMDKSWLFLAHSLELHDLIISALLLNRVTPRYALASFVGERALKRKPFRTTWRGQPLTLVPDAFLSFRAGEGRQRLLIEHDRGTEGQQHFRRRIRAYLAYLREERVPVAFTTFVGAARRDTMRQWTRAELADAGGAGLAGMFWFADLPRPPGPDIWISPVWFTPYDVPPQPLLGA